MTKRNLKAEVVKLTYRVKELEERLCPCQLHDWKRIETAYEFDGFSVDSRYIFQCKRCGKQKSDIVP